MGTIIHKLQNFRAQKSAEIYYEVGKANPYHVHFYSEGSSAYTLRYADEPTALFNAKLHCNQ